MSGDVFIVPDVHGHLDLAAGLLERAGILSESWDRQRDVDVTVVQLGDLLNCVGSSVVDDLRCLDHAREWFDVLLVGNHEHPYWGGPAFSGYHRDLYIDGRIRSTLGDLYRPAISVGGVLVTHAGLTVAALEALEVTSAWGAEVALTQLWREDPTGPIFSTIGAARGGRHPQGGVLWSDWHEPKATVFSQLVGHTPGDGPRWQGGAGPEHDGEPFALCLDVGAGKGRSQIVGAWIRGGKVELIAHTLGEEEAAA